MVLVAREALFELADFEEVVGVDELAELAEEGDMFADIATQALKLGVLLDKALHVLHRLDARVGRRLRLELDDVVLDRGAEIAQVVVQVRGEEWIVVDGEHDLLGAVLGVHDGAPVVDAEELMHHRLVRPLRQERRDGIVAAVEHEEERRHVRAAEVEERRV